MRNSACARARSAAVAAVLAAVAGLLLAASSEATLTRAVARLEPASAEIVFREPLRYAVIVRERDGVRTLRGRGDAIVDGATYVTIERVGPETLVLRTASREREWTERGEPLAGMPGHRFLGTVLLERVAYRYRGVTSLGNPDSVLVSLGGGSATLELETLERSEVEVAGLGGELAGGSLLSRIRVREVSAGEYVLHRGEVRLLLDHGGPLLSELRPLILPMVSLQGGLRFSIRCGATDGVLSRDGFAVTSAKLMARLGLETGDVIRSVNRVPADGLRNLLQIYRDIRRNPGLPKIELEIDRDGRRLLRTYWLR